MTTLRFPAKQFRALPSPTGASRVGIFYASAVGIPDSLMKWRDVNPREINRRSSVYRGIVQTLLQEPERFHERNRGITVVAEEIAFDEKKHEVVLTLSDPKLHGVVDGAHTLNAVIENQAGLLELNSTPYVFIKAVVGVDADQIAEIAGGLNTSQQVDLKSLENLRSHFDGLHKVVAAEPYANQIAYRMNEEKPIDVREILYYLAVFDCSVYDDKVHPVTLFGRKEGIVRRFSEQAADPAVGDSFKILISRAPEILRLRDEIEKRAVAHESVGRYKAAKGTRVRSAKNHGNLLHFLGETIDGKVSLGWIMPMLGAFRANVVWDQPKGTFSWKVPLDELLDLCIEDVLLGIVDVHQRENSRPEYVGRAAIAWRMSYNSVSQAILQWELNQSRRAKR
jgi:hypothetical protein